MHTGVWVFEFGYRGNSVFEHREGSRYLNKTGVSIYVLIRITRPLRSNSSDKIFRVSVSEQYGYQDSSVLINDQKCKLNFSLGCMLRVCVPNVWWRLVPDIVTNRDPGPDFYRDSKFVNPELTGNEVYTESNLSSLLFETNQDCLENQGCQIWKWEIGQSIQRNWPKLTTLKWPLIG